jgi:alkanesulfonate monooxygenase SsuD/methylene tetrahydromethanopterin reductase-like flavin-dependent oxidoreductase (luciferase family)
MDIGIGLPSTIPGIPARLILDWAAAAERVGFSTLGVIDRIVYANFEPLPTLAAAAAVTERIGLTTAVLIGPYRGNGALLAKQLATVDSISNGRLSVGIAVGPREDDYEAAGSSFRERGHDFDRQLAELRAVWAGKPRGHAERIGPPPAQAGGPPLLIGSNIAATFRRIAELGVGWIFGGGGPEAFAAGADQARRAWREASRAGEPVWSSTRTSASDRTPRTTRTATSATTTGSWARISPGRSLTVPSPHQRRSPTPSPATKTPAATS